MTLFSVDKNSDNRLYPSVNASDVQQNPMAHATSSISPRAAGTTGAGKVTTKNSRIIANDGTNNVGLFGFDDAGRMVVKVAKTGYDANNATDDQLIFNSSQNVFKIVGSGLTTTPAVTVPNPGAGKFSSDTGITVIPHNLGYVPVVIAYIDDGFGTTPLTYNFNHGTSSGITGTSWATIFSRADSTNLTIFTDVLVYATSWPFNGQTFSVKYFLLQETANI